MKNTSSYKFNDYKNALGKLKGIRLLKKIEEITNSIFKTDTSFEKSRQVLGKNKEKTVIKAVIESNFDKIKEFSEDFYKVYDVAAAKQHLTRDFIRSALDKLNHGFSAFDKELILGSLDISDLYDKYYKDWIHTMRNSETAKTIINYQTKKPKYLHKIIKDKSLNNHYTVILYDKTKGFYHVPFSKHFNSHLTQISSSMSTLAARLSQYSGTKEQKTYIKFFKQYAKCLKISRVRELEPEWKKLDQIWMDIKYPIQIVHDMEYGYADPLRTKVIPDFSIRFVDNSFNKENKYIEMVQQIMVKYFKKRNTALSHQGLSALSNSFASIYYLPTHTGMSYHFRFSGQCIPNRHDVRTKKGVKIYFDPISTAMRSENVKALVKKVFKGKNLINKINSVDSIINHVSSHEFGHAIYGLDAVKKHISTETKSLLEEPRAELTALTTMLLLNEQRVLSNKQLQDTLFNFAAHDLRRFANYNSSSTKPYTISATNTYKIYGKYGYIKRVGDKLNVDLSKTRRVLKVFKDQFEEILDAEDKKDGIKIESIIKEMQKETKLVKWLVKRIKAD
jgi:hypothetical protein